MVHFLLFGVVLEYKFKQNIHLVQVRKTYEVYKQSLTALLKGGYAGAISTPSHKLPASRCYRCVKSTGKIR